MCILGTTLILMSDRSSKQIKDIKREDQVMTNIEKNEYKKVAQVTTSIHENFLTLIPKKLLNNTNDIIITAGHPVWVNSDKNRVYSKNIDGVTEITMTNTFYNLQFEDECAYYAEGLLIDSLSPNFYIGKLEKDLYFDTLKYNNQYLIHEEDDPRRKKPRMAHSYPIKEQADIQSMKGPTIVPVRGGYGAVHLRKRT